jgi:hypothetical protein
MLIRVNKRFGYLTIAKLKHKAKAKNRKMRNREKRPKKRDLRFTKKA